MDIVREICDEMQRKKIARGEATLRKTPPDSMTANIIGLSVPTALAAAMFVSFLAEVAAVNPGAVPQLLVFGGLAAVAITILGVGTFRPQTRLLDNKWIRGIFAVGIVIFLVLAGGAILRFLPLLFPHR